MGVEVSSRRLSFTRDGRALAVADRHGVTVLDVRSEYCERVALDDVHAVAAFTDHLWVLRRDGEVARIGLDGRIERDRARVAFDPGATLIPASIGVTAALWTAHEPQILLDDLGTVVVHGVTESAELVVPASGRRTLRCTGSRVTLPSNASCVVPRGGRILGGAMVLDGSAAALIAEYAHGREAVVLAAATGRILQSLALPAGTVRIAARRGLAVVRHAPRELAILDLRFARAIGTVVLDGEPEDFAIDPDGRVLAVATDGEHVDLVPVRSGIAEVSIARRPAPADAPPPDSGAPSNGAIEVRALSNGAIDIGDRSSLSIDVGSRSNAAIEVGALSNGATDVASVSSISIDVGSRSNQAIDIAARSRIAIDVGSRSNRAIDIGALSNAAIEVGAAPSGRAQAIAALEPREPIVPAAREAALAELDTELTTVMLWTLRAIAQAWDTRRIGYGNEGKHPFEHEVAAIVGANHGFAGDYVAAAYDRVVAHEQALASTPHRGPETPLGQLIAELGLSPAAVEILLVIAAPALHGELARLYGVLANDPARALVDELLVQQVLAGRTNRHDVAAELHPAATLIRLGLVTAEPSRTRPFAGLAVDPVVLARLRAEPLDLGAALVARGADRTLAQLELAPGVLDRAFAALGKAHAPARICVRGRIGSGRRALLATLAGAAHRPLGVIDAALLARASFATELRGALRRAQLAGMLPTVVGLDAVVLDGGTADDIAREVLRAHPGPLALVLPLGAAAPLPAGHVAIDLPVLSETERLAVWQREVGAAGLWLRDPDGVAARHRVGPGVIHRAVAAAREAVREAEPCDDAIDVFLRQRRDARLATHARRVERLATWSDLVLPPDITDSLRELVARVRHRRTVFEQWGMERRIATSRGLTALFQGQPGTGKTLVAGVVARELGLELYQVDLSKIMSKWIGETERNLAEIFDAAEDGQVILLFDEADSLFAKRTEVRSSNDRYANLEVNYLLQRLDHFDGIAILTTNNGGSIDPAFKRRLSFRLSFPFPDEDTRAQLWRAHLPPELPRAGELVFDALARKYQLSGGYIRNACLRAAFLAAQDETALAQHHLERAVALEFAELGKLSTAGALD